MADAGGRREQFRRRRARADELATGFGRTATHPLMVVTALGVFIAVLCFWVARSTALERAVAALEAVPGAQETYRGRHGRYGTVDELVSEGFLESSRIATYRLEVRLGEDPTRRWCARLRPSGPRVPFYWIGPGSGGVVVDPRRSPFAPDCSLPAAESYSLERD